MGVLALWMAPAAANAATITVGPTDDAANGSFDDTGCTLRDAVQAANDNSNVPNGCPGDNAGADTIILQSGQTYTLTQHLVDDTNAKGDLDITGPTTIKASGSGLATINTDIGCTAGGCTPGADRVIDVRDTAGSVTLDHIKVTNGVVANQVVDDPGAAFTGGGGILNAAPLTVKDSEIVGNSISGTGITFGGGIYTRGSLGTLTMTGSTVANNSGTALGNASTETVGGGVTAYESSPTVEITNSTISGNKVTGSSGGAPGNVGGIDLGDNGNHPVATLTNDTITGNRALQPGNGVTGGLQIVAGTMTGNLIAGNSDPFDEFMDCDNTGTATSGGGNFVGEASQVGDCGFNQPNDLIGPNTAPINPNIGTLVDNGGPTRTHILNPGSPAINRGGTCPTTDQRGFFRGPVAPCDAGAVEVGAPATLPTQPGPPQPPPDNSFKFGNAKKNKKKGTAALDVTVPGAGHLDLSGAGLKPSSADASGAGDVSLTVAATGKAKKKLKKKGKKTFDPTVTFTPSGGTANADDTAVKLVKK